MIANILADMDELVPSTRDTICKLRSEFKNLVISMKKSLIEKDKSNELKFDDFKEDFIYDLPESTRDQIQHYFEKKSEGISRAKDYNSLFLVLSHCWDYLNPYLLQHIVYEYGGDLKHPMDEYTHNLEEFRNATDVGTFWEAQDPISREVREPLPQFRKIITEHELSKVCTLQCIENIRLDLCQDLRLRSFAMYIAKLDRGSLVITWFVTSKVAELLVDMEPQEDVSFRVRPVPVVEAIKGQC